jgi:hypothetical protein
MRQKYIFLYFPGRGVIDRALLSPLIFKGDQNLTLKALPKFVPHGPPLPMYVLPKPFPIPKLIPHDIKVSILS